MNGKLTRREVLARSGVCLGASVAGVGISCASAETDNRKDDGAPFRYCLNTGTILGHKLSIEDEVDLAAKAGYSGIEPWIRSLRAYDDQGKSLDDLRKRITDAGLLVESAIGFPAWAVDDDQRRAKGLEEFKRDMDLIARIGGLRIAAPPAGINNSPNVDLNRVAERYHVVLELGREMGVVPQLEIWGSANTLGRVSEAAYVAIQAGHPDACLLLDVFHMYKGGSSFDSLKLLNGAAMHAFHINDYPADPPRATVNDSHRVFPGDGVAPTDQILRTLHGTGFRGALSLELFNPEYWQRDALDVAKTGIEKMRAAVQKALG